MGLAAREAKSNEKAADVTAKAEAEATAKAEAEAKAKEAEDNAVKEIRRVIGSVLYMDELLRRPASGPMRELLEDPRAAQFKELATLREALEVLTLLAQEAGLQLQAAEEAPAQCASEGQQAADAEAAPVPAAVDPVAVVSGPVVLATLATVVPPQAWGGGITSQEPYQLMLNIWRWQEDGPAAVGNIWDLSLIHI
mgnify:CR=1 FL=1